MADDITKRLRYFDKQFLVEADFTDEQKYHLDRRRRHNRLLHTPGIAKGLDVEKTDAKKVKVSPGTAVDIEGQEIVQVVDFSIDLSNASIYPLGSPIYITIKYKEITADPQPPEQPNNATRYTEQPLIEAKTTAPQSDAEDTVILLAKFQLDGNGNVPGKVGDKLDNGVIPMPTSVVGVRKTVGSVLADNAVSISKLKKELVAAGSTTLDGSVSGGSTASIDAFTTPLVKPSSAFLLIYAYSTNPGAKFSWVQGYVTDATSIKQVVTFKIEGSNKITVNYRIYAVLEA